MTIDPKLLSPSELQAIDAQASILMKQGIRLLSDHQPDSITKALACFDNALDLRRLLPIETNSAFRYGLAACWLNRADALVRLSDPTAISVALHSYDEAILLLRGLPLLEDPRFPRRMAIAHQNRGLALQTQGASAIAEAVSAFSEAIEILNHDQSMLIPDRQYLLAAVWMNLANARTSETAIQSGPLAREAAQRAIALAKNLETNDADSAEVGLKARHILCQIISRYLPLTAGSDETTTDYVHEATDAADDGLSVIRLWERQGITRFRNIAYDLFRFGAYVYARYQPQFLNEFIRDNVDPSQSSSEYVESVEMREAAQEVLELSTRTGR